MAHFSTSFIEPLIWFGSKFVIILYFIWMAKRWPKLMNYWERVERHLPRHESHRKNFLFFKEIRFHTIAISVTLLGESLHASQKVSSGLFVFLIFSVEHTMSIVAGVYRGIYCTNNTSLETYFVQAWPQLYTITPYDGGWMAFVIEIINYYCTFIWAYMDLLIIAVSVCLSTRLQQLNDYLERFRGMDMCRTFWTNQRRHYSNISRLITKVDTAMSVITISAVSSNLYFILIQLLHSFE